MTWCPARSPPWHTNSTCPTETKIKKVLEMINQVTEESTTVTMAEAEQAARQHRQLIEIDGFPITTADALDQWGRFMKTRQYCQAQADLATNQLTSAQEEARRHQALTKRAAATERLAREIYFALEVDECSEDVMALIPDWPDVAELTVEQIETAAECIACHRRTRGGEHPGRINT
jgi:hypothetical protein